MNFGDYCVEVIPDCEFRLDGGAMFGVVPRNLWSRVSPPDEQNRIRMNMNCLFIEAGSERILIDTGIGNKWSEKHRAMYGIDRQRSLDESLRAITGVGSEDITIVVNTHLHFDHAGGLTRRAADGDSALRTGRDVSGRSLLPSSLEITIIPAHRPGVALSRQRSRAVTQGGDDQ